MKDPREQVLKAIALFENKEFTLSIGLNRIKSVSFSLKMGGNPMKRSLSLIIILLLLFVGCSEGSKTGPSVSIEQAQKVATGYYHMVKISKSEVKLVSENFVKENENPVYFVIEGISEDGRPLIVFVESNNETKHLLNT